MRIKLLKLYLLLFVWGVSISTYSETPAKEVRAVWLTTNWNLDWPSPSLSAEGQQKQLIKILDELEKANFNTVFFQARIRGDVAYESSIEPKSVFFQRTSFDPLAFAIRECHKRGLECHAWFVTFPLGTPKQVAQYKNTSIVNTHPEICKLHDGEWYLDPGNPFAQQYILKLVNEIVAKYDIDGIHFDYIRYPENGKKFDDKDTFFKYGNGMPLAQWRRNNINNLVFSIYDKVKQQKPWVQVSSSPLGRYRELPPRNSGWTAYESVYQDAGLWLKKGKHDAIYPMMYYKDNLFYPYLEDWMANNNGRIVVPGLGAYRMMSNEGNWSSKDLVDQVNYIRKHHVDGQAYFRVGSVLGDTKGLFSTLKKDYYQNPAKLPSLYWLRDCAPNSPIELEAFTNDKGRFCLKWKPANTSESQTYTIYKSSSEDIDLNDPHNILKAGVSGNSIQLSIKDDDEEGVYYFVTASNRFHNESVPCFPVYYIHSKEER